MEFRTRYEAYRDNQKGVCIRAIDQTGLVVNQMADLTDDLQKASNVATLYNANHLMPEHFPQVTERLLGILL